MSAGEHELNREQLSAEQRNGQTGSEELLSEADAASRGAVSIDTLRMFAQCGLLTPIIKDGTSFFTAAEIGTLFYSRTKDDHLPFSTAESGGRAADAATEPFGSSPSSAPSSAAPGAEIGPSGEPAPTADESIVATADDAASVEATTQVGEERPFGDPTVLLDHLLSDATNDLFDQTSQSRPQDGVSPTVDFILKGSPSAGASRASLPPSSAGEQFGAEDAAVFGTASAERHAAAAAYSRSGSETPRGNELLEVNQAFVEVNKGLKEQIQILRDERDWLRRRVEQLENRSEREQMILLSESETIRSLVSKDKRSFWQRALPWFGSDRRNADLGRTGRDDE